LDHSEFRKEKVSLEERRKDWKNRGWGPGGGEGTDTVLNEAKKLYCD